MSLSRSFTVMSILITVTDTIFLHFDHWQCQKYRSYLLQSMGNSPRLGHAVLPRKDGLDVPGEHAVDDGVHEQHPDAAGQGVLVAGAELRADPDVVPLSPHSLLLEVREVGTAESKSHVRNQALKILSMFDLIKIL